MKNLIFAFSLAPLFIGCTKSYYSSKNLSLSVQPIVINAKTLNNKLENIIFDFTIINDSEQDVSFYFSEDEVIIFTNGNGGRLKILPGIKAKLINFQSISKEKLIVEDTDYEFQSHIKIAKKDSYNFKLPINHFENMQNLNKGQYIIYFEYKTKTKITEFFGFSPFSKSQITTKLKKIAFDNKLISNYVFLEID